MSSSEQDPFSGETNDQREVGLEQNRATRIALATFQEVVLAVANQLSSDKCQRVVKRGVADFQALIADDIISLEQEIRAKIALTAAGKMVNVDTPFPGMMWIREPLNDKVTRRLQNNGSPVLIQPTGPARRSDYAVIAIPGDSIAEGWKLYRREKGGSRKGYSMVEIPPDVGDLVHLGRDDTQSGIYGFTILTGRNTQDAYAAYIDGSHVTVETGPGDLVVRDHSFLGTSLTYVTRDPLPTSS